SQRCCRLLLRTQSMSAFNEPRGPYLAPGMTGRQINALVDRARRPILARLAVKLSRLLAIPYLYVGFGLRLLMARAFFSDGQSKIEGPVVRFDWLRLDYAITLPTDLSDAALQAMQTQYANLPFSANTAAYVFTYAAFILPICLVIGFATRVAAFGLLV